MRRRRRAPRGTRCKMGDTDFSCPMPSDPTRFVLVGTSHAGNVGAAARAMKVMGFSDLVLVAPRFANVRAAPRRSRWPAARPTCSPARASSPTLAEALDGITYACATAMTPRDFGPPNRAPRELFAELAPSSHRVAFVFGSERFGLSNDDVYACHACLSDPDRLRATARSTWRRRCSCVAYDWRQALRRLRRAAAPPSSRARPTRSRCAACVAHWQRALVALDFLDPAAPQEADGAAAPARQPRRAQRGRGAHPARHRREQSHERCR